MKDGWMKNDEGWMKNDEGWWFQAVEGFWWVVDDEQAPTTTVTLLMDPSGSSYSIHDYDVSLSEKCCFT